MTNPTNTFLHTLSNIAQHNDHRYGVVFDGDGNVEGQMPTPVDVGHPATVHQRTNAVAILKDVASVQHHCTILILTAPSRSRRV